MAFHLTNERLGGLLRSLGFEPRELVKDAFRRWEHPDSGCILLLPANKTQEAPRPADLVGMKAHLELQGHLDAEAFEFFVTEGKLPVGQSDSN